MCEQRQQTFAVCGQDCGSCGCLGVLCTGCEAAGGQVFHSPEGCPSTAASARKKGSGTAGSAGKSPAASGRTPGIRQYPMRRSPQTSDCGWTT